MIKRYITRSDGVRQRYTFKSQKSYSRLYIKGKSKGKLFKVKTKRGIKRVRVKNIKKFKSKRIRTKENIYVENQREEIIDMFDNLAQGSLKGYDNQHFRQALLSNLNQATYNVESDGVIQLNAGYNGAPPVKVRYNPKTNHMQSYVRGYLLK